MDAKVDQFIANNKLPDGYDEKIQIEKAATGLSKELLYMKRITEYANLKYKKRFLVNKKKMVVPAKELE